MQWNNMCSREKRERRECEMKSKRETLTKTYTSSVGLFCSASLSLPFLVHLHLYFLYLSIRHTARASHASTAPICSSFKMNEWDKDKDRDKLKQMDCTESFLECIKFSINCLEFHELLLRTTLEENIALL